MEELDPEDLRVLVRVLRALRDWDQTELARAAGVDASSISHYETGRTVPSPRTIERLAGAVGLPASFVETSLLPVLSAARVVSAPFTEEGCEDLEPIVADFSRVLTGTIRSTLATFLRLF